jgi:hypothetical protein
MSEIDYSPFTKEEFQTIELQLKEVKTFLPEHLMNPMWSYCTRIRGKRENQPCSCRTSAGLWSNCVTDVRNFVKERNVSNG